MPQHQASFMALFTSFSTALKISTHTHTRIPAKALCTAGRCAKFRIKAAMTVMITSDGNTTPSVANMPPSKGVNKAECDAKIKKYSEYAEGLRK